MEPSLDFLPGDRSCRIPIVLGQTAVEFRLLRLR